MTDLSALFFRAYGNLPTDERNQVIIVIEGKPYTWDRAYDEIKSETEVGKKILEKMEKLGILNETRQ